MSRDILWVVYTEILQYLGGIIVSGNVLLLEIISLLIRHKIIGEVDEKKERKKV